ncbi:MAG: hypothetical protein L0Z50_00770 [Verrucomicrobiales bacterium]|nr:hypothetical protein [Verrucomicrobiales bacterium]
METRPSKILGDGQSAVLHSHHVDHLAPVVGVVLVDQTALTDVVCAVRINRRSAPLTSSLMREHLAGTRLGQLHQQLQVVSKFLRSCEVK